MVSSAGSFKSFINHLLYGVPSEILTHFLQVNLKVVLIVSIRKLEIFYEFY